MDSINDRLDSDNNIIENVNGEVEPERITEYGEEEEEWEEEGEEDEEGEEGEDGEEGEEGEEGEDEKKD
jgi:hypothetical protein